MRLQPQQAGRIGEHRARVGLGEALALQRVQEDLGVGPRHVGVGLAVLRRVAEIAPAVDHLLGRAAADAELQPPAGDQVGGAGVLDHVERVLVAHVDDGGAELDAARLGARSREQREGRAELAGEMVDAEIGPVRADFLGGDRQVDGLEQRVGRRACAGLRGGRPMAEGEETDLFHAEQVRRRATEINLAACAHRRQTVHSSLHCRTLARGSRLAEACAPLQLLLRKLAEGVGHRAPLAQRD